MFEERQTAFDESNDAELEIEALVGLNSPVSAAVVPPGNPGFQLPKRVWIGMLACYGVFFAAILGATGGSASAIFMIVISMLYTAIYFGVARIAVKQAGPEDVSPLDRGKPLQTWTGPMDAVAVYGQILIVPFAVAIFGLAILTIVAFQ